MAVPPALITAAAKSALHGFDNVIRILESKCQSGYSNIETILWVEQRRKFEVWTADTGALEKHQSSLGFHLKDDGDVGSEIRLLLIDLGRHLETAYNILTEAGNIDEGPQETFLDDNEPPLTRTRNFVATTIQCLLQMTLIVKSSAQIDFLKSIEGQDAVDQVQDHSSRLRVEFPNSKSQVIERLAWASSRRHAYLLYRRRCRTSRPPGPHFVSDQNDSISHSSSVQMSSLASSASGEVNSIPTNSTFTDSHPPYRCPCCLSDVIVIDKQSKLKHFFYDLKPYVCTIEPCSRPRAVYSTRSEWHTHLRTAHASLGYGTGKIDDDACPICCQPFHNERSESGWVRHVARHMQDLALSACPEEAQDAESLGFDGDIDTDDSDSSSEDETAMTKNRQQPKPILSSANPKEFKVGGQKESRFREKENPFGERSRNQTETIGEENVTINSPLAQRTSKPEYSGSRTSQDSIEKHTSEIQQDREAGQRSKDKRVMKDNKDVKGLEKAQAEDQHQREVAEFWEGLRERKRQQAFETKQNAKILSRNLSRSPYNEKGQSDVSAKIATPQLSVTDSQAPAHRTSPSRISGQSFPFRYPQTSPSQQEQTSKSISEHHEEANQPPGGSVYESSTSPVLSSRDSSEESSMKSGSDDYYGPPQTTHESALHQNTEIRSRLFTPQIGQDPDTLSSPGSHQGAEHLKRRRDWASSPPSANDSAAGGEEASEVDSEVQEFWDNFIQARGRSARRPRARSSLEAQSLGARDPRLQLA